ncbi:hypothetical protein WJX84_000816 [Apatococcus fuscideae]|uniref:Tyrosine specific protein phosphatases domain-containing protein n=1 Tax=Apatococcus fuscideae TaxID=2026836 RepID=A0AAW1T897_9CHLO
MSENGLDSKTAQLPQTSAGAAVPVSLLPDLSLPELKDTGGGPPGASGGQGPPSVLQKLQKWGDYPSYGEPVQPTLFIPMKTPLSTTIHWGWTLPTPPLHSLTVQQLLAEQAAKQHTVGLILDLSNHATLYTEDLPPGLEYEHIMLQSKVFPHPAAINEVVKAARSFWSRQPSQYIAIHCAYGFNRTGFVVSSMSSLWLSCIPATQPHHPDALQAEIWPQASRAAQQQLQEWKWHQALMIIRVAIVEDHPALAAERMRAVNQLLRHMSRQLQKLRGCRQSQDKQPQSSTAGTGVENDSLGLDQRAIMAQLAASRLKARSQKRLETLISAGSEDASE